MNIPFSAEVELYRWQNAPMGYRSRPGEDFGVFRIPGPSNVTLHVLATSGDDEFHWEHVSVSLPNRCPNWPEMDFIKRLFWRDDECVMQLHPPRSEHVNLHPFCLHLWKPVGQEIPQPPSILVGPDSAKAGTL